LHRRSACSGGELAALGAGEVAGDGEAEARAAAGARAGLALLVGPVEAFEDVGEVILGDAGSGVRNGYLYSFAADVAFHGYETAGGREPKGVVE
jgi:hypothetical protein